MLFASVCVYMGKGEVGEEDPLRRKGAQKLIFPAFLYVSLPPSTSNLWGGVGGGGGGECGP